MSDLRIARRVATVTATLVILVIGVVAPASAHVDLIESSPADQARLAHAPTEIELIFSEAVEPAGEGILLVDTNGATVATSVSQPTEQRVVVTPTQPLTPEEYAIVWTVRAGDAHPRSGSVLFSVAQQPAASNPGQPNPTAEGLPSTGLESPAGDIEAPIALSTSIEPPNTAPAEGLGSLGRWMSLLGALVGIGALAFAATALTGTAREAREPAYWVRRSGLLIIAGTGLEALAASMVLNGSIFAAVSPDAFLSTLWGGLGIALLLRLVGGIAMVRGAETVVTPVDPAHETSPLGASPPAEPGHLATIAIPTKADTAYRLDVSRSLIAVGGVTAVALSYLFDGHTASASPALLVKGADVAHVVGAGVWVGGVLMLGRTLAGRWRRGVSLDAAGLAVRFSRIAALALATVTVAGLMLTWSILDSPGELVSTDWGRLLLAKLAVVGVAAALGGYNHRYVVPAVASENDNEVAANLLRRVVTVEGIALVAVVAITAVLIGAAS